MENFRGVRSADAELDRVSIFLGPNSSGKTTLLHAIRFACDAVRVALESDHKARIYTADDDREWIEVGQDVTIGDFSRLLSVADGQSLFVDQITGRGVFFYVHLIFDASDPMEEIYVEVKWGNNEQLKLTVRVLSDMIVQSFGPARRKTLEFVRSLKQLVGERCPRAIFIPPFYGAVTNEEYQSRAVVDRRLGSGDQSHVVRNLVSALSTEQFDQLNAFLEATLKARITSRTFGDAVHTESPMRLMFQDTNGAVEISSAGAGLVNLVALFSALSRWQAESQRRNVLFLLDEPEAHLHPRLQADGAERLARLVTQDFGGQFIAATHSVDILNRLSLRGARLLRTDRSAEPSVVKLDTDSELFDELSNWADLTPYTAINFLASRRVVFCEGDSDKDVLTRVMQLRFRNDPSKLALAQRWAIVPLHGSGNANIVGLLRRLLANELVRSKSGQAQFCVVVVLDRDHERPVGVRQDAQPGILHTEQVWSRHSIESLFVDPAVLGQWVRARARAATPPDIAVRIARAIDEANGDKTLRDEAVQQLTASLHASGISASGGRAMGGKKLTVSAVERAQSLVDADPATWQRGKDRARFVLQRVREAIPLPERNQFPTNLSHLLERADINHIGDIQAAIPAEVGALLDRLALP